jgi:hypothetical protein
LSPTSITVVTDNFKSKNAKGNYFTFSSLRFGILAFSFLLWCFRFVKIKKNRNEENTKMAAYGANR